MTAEGRLCSTCGHCAGKVRMEGWCSHRRWVVEVEKSDGLLGSRCWTPPGCFGVVDEREEG